MSDEIKQAEETAAPEAAQENKDGAAKAPEKKPEQAPKVKKSWKMTRGEWILIGIAVVLCIIVALLNLRPQEAVGTLAVVSGTGEEFDAEFDMILQRSLTRPGVFSGDITINGVTYTSDGGETGNEIGFFEGIVDMFTGQYDLPDDFVADDGSVLTLESIGFGRGYVPETVSFTLDGVSWEQAETEE